MDPEKGLSLPLQVERCIHYWWGKEGAGRQGGVQIREAQNKHLWIFANQLNLCLIQTITIEVKHASAVEKRGLLVPLASSLLTLHS